MNLHPGTILTITPTELVAGGDALAKIDGFPVFASNVFPGDVARVRLYEVKKGFAKADLVELVTPSPWRRAMPCPVANECGGCDWTALRLDKQLEAKRHILTESLRRIGKFDIATLPEITMHSSPLNYRLRSRLHRDGDAIGFYAMRSNRVVPLARECEVVGVETARVIPSVESRDPGGPGGSARMSGTTGMEGGDVVTTGGAASRGATGSGTGSALRTTGAPPPAQVPRLDARDDIWELGGELIEDERELTLTVNEFTYRLHTRAFFQVNRHLLGTMLRLVAGHASRVQSRKTAVDLYGGVGFFTLPIAKLFERVTMIEGSPLSARYARMNVPPHVKVIAAPVEEKMRTLPDVDFTFLDPPRAGTRREVISTIAERTKEIIAYLSCDPVTFSRDASRLIASGWRLASLDLLDLFPNTHHVETLSSFERAQ